MASQRDAYEEAEACTACFFERLPCALARRIFAALPADARMRCSEVCRDWRRLLADCSMWLRLDMSSASGVVWRDEQHAADALLAAAAARAGGQLEALEASRWHVSYDALLRVAHANSGALRALRFQAHVPFFDAEELEDLLRAAPRLQVLEAGLKCGLADARRLLRNNTLRLRNLSVRGRAPDELALPALVADVAAHASLTKLTLEGADLSAAPQGLDALVDAALGPSSIFSSTDARCRRLLRPRWRACLAAARWRDW
jgi:hypothetical protein